MAAPILSNCCQPNGRHPDYASYGLYALNTHVLALKYELSVKFKAI